MLEGYRTIIAAVISLIGSITAQLGVEIDAAGITNAVMAIGGAGAAIYFRIIAKP